jgi:Fe-Mn family superoxide dismutase
LFKLPDLPYAYEALEPTISAATLHLHHDKHHARYVTVVNELVKGGADWTLEAVILESTAKGDRKLADNAGQAWNHGFFWESMASAYRVPSGKLLDAIQRDFGSLDALAAKFKEAGAGHFGSGWVWLVAKAGKVSVVTTHDGDTVVTDKEAVPLLVCDVWEHAYYLDHKNDRAGFLAGWWSGLANWRFAEAQFAASLGEGTRWRYP